MGRSSVHSAAVIVAALFAICPSAAAAQVSSGDAGATRAYLQADLASTRTEVKGIPAALAAMTALDGRLQMECPGVLAGEPQPAKGTLPSASALAIDAEQAAAALGVAEHTELTRLRGLAQAVSRLSWSSPSLTRLVRSSIAAELAQAAVPPPELCVDLHAWVSSGYQTASAATQRYVRRESTLSQQAEAGKHVLGNLAPYEDSADRALARQILAIEKRAIQTLVPNVLAALGKTAEVLHGPAAVPAS